MNDSYEIHPDDIKMLCSVNFSGVVRIKPKKQEEISELKPNLDKHDKYITALAKELASKVEKIIFDNLKNGSRL